MNFIAVAALIVKLITVTIFFIVIHRGPLISTDQSNGCSAHLIFFVIEIKIKYLK